MPSMHADDWLDALDKALSAYDDGRFVRCERALERLLRDAPDDVEPEDVADAKYYLALAIDRRGESQMVDRWLGEVHRLAPDIYPPPLRLGSAEFQNLVDGALRSIPERFRVVLDQVQIVVRDYPGSEAADPFLLGLYSGVPRTERDHDIADHLDTVFIYKRSHELDFTTREELADQVRRTVIHEIGHHFGLDEDDMGEYA
jgi:predicted Zn-dependent protease with MMP-like domain